MESYINEESDTQFANRHIEFMAGLYMRTLNPLCLENIEMLKKFKGEVNGKSITEPKDRKIVVKWR